MWPIAIILPCQHTALLGNVGTDGSGIVCLRI
jgi:hypothetical protein